MGDIRMIRTGTETAGLFKTKGGSRLPAPNGDGSSAPARFRDIGLPTKSALLKATGSAPIFIESISRAEFGA